MTGRATRDRAGGPAPRPEHRPKRPLWICVADGAAWPCAPIRAQMIEAYRADRVALAYHMLRLMATAAHDLNARRPARLYRRFVGWTLPDGARCRSCRQPLHDALPGLPPRLFPCDEDAAPPLSAPR